MQESLIEDALVADKEEKPRAEYDSPWKDVLSVYFEQFVKYCWPEHYQDIDWTKGYTSLDKELSRISRNAVSGNRVADKLMEVYRKEGEPTWVLIHVDVQSGEDKDFEKRMFMYRYRAFDLYQKPMASLAVLIDTDKHWRPERYREELWGSSIEMRFPIVKLLDYQARTAELEASQNPFAAVILAQLAAMQKASHEAKLDIKLELTRRLYKKGWGKEDILLLYKFLDWVIALPKPLELTYHHGVEKIEEENQVNYITTAERIGIEKGRQLGIHQGVQQGIHQGVQQGERIFLECLLRDKFEQIPLEYQKQIEQASAELLLEWGRRVLRSQTINDVFED